MKNLNPRRSRAWLVCVALIAIAASSCLKVTDNIGDQATADMTGGGRQERGPGLIHAYGCGACHEIPGVDGAHGLVGPSLDRVGNRMVIAGVLSNTPDNLINWIKNPPAIDSMTAMPNMGVTDHDARDIAAYLYTLR